MFKPFKSFKTWAGLFDGLTDLNGLNYLNPLSVAPLVLLPIASAWFYFALTRPALSFSPISKWRPCTASSAS